MVTYLSQENDGVILWYCSSLAYALGLLQDHSQTEEIACFYRSRSSGIEPVLLSEQQVQRHQKKHVSDMDGSCLQLCFQMWSEGRQTPSVAPSKACLNSTAQKIPKSVGSRTQRFLNPLLTSNCENVSLSYCTVLGITSTRPIRQ